MARQSTAPRCSICRSQGHYSTTCGLKPAKDNRCMLFGSNLLQRKPGKPWTKEEHMAFLKGLEVYGPSQWKHISENLVKTRTPAQIASHAQKYYLWLKAVANDPEKKTKCSIFQVQKTKSVISSSFPQIQAFKPPISQVSSSTANGGATETTLQVHPSANITATNPFSFLSMFPTIANRYSCYKVAAPSNWQKFSETNYLVPNPMSNVSFVQKMYNASRYQSPFCLFPNIHL